VMIFLSTGLLAWKDPAWARWRFMVALVLFNFT